MDIIFHCISKQSSVNAVWQFSLHTGSLPYWENVRGQISQTVKIKTAL